MTKSTSKIKKEMKASSRESSNPLTPDQLLSSGSVMLNLACTNKAEGFAPKGKYIFFVGDSSSGKTFLALTCFAEAAISKHFDKYRLIYDNVEDGALMDIRKYFGKGVASRLEAPSYENDQAVYSETVEDFYYHLDDALEEAEDGRPFIYVLDSQDSLTSDYELEKFSEHKKAARDGKNSAGSYGDGKAKIHSEGLRKAIAPLSRTGSILVIISQTRDNLGFGFEKKTRSGGRALRFYAALEIWTGHKGMITKTVKGKKRELGIRASVQIKKNRLTGKRREVEIPIYHALGIDDVGSCVDFLIEEKVFPKEGKSTIVAEDFEFEGTRDSLIKLIEEEDLEGDLHAIVEEYWNEVEEACAPKRKRRYE